MFSPVETLTVAQVESLLGRKALTWAGECQYVTPRLFEKIGPPPLDDLVLTACSTHVAIGEWQGQASQRWRQWKPEQLAAGRIGHVWIALADGRVLDPTLWALEGHDPYIYVGNAGLYCEYEPEPSIDSKLAALMQGRPQAWDW